MWVLDFITAETILLAVMECSELSLLDNQASRAQPILNTPHLPSPTCSSPSQDRRLKARVCRAFPVAPRPMQVAGRPGSTVSGAGCTLSPSSTRTVLCGLVSDPQGRWHAESISRERRSLGWALHTSPEFSGALGDAELIDGAVGEHADMTLVAVAKLSVWSLDLDGGSVVAAMVHHLKHRYRRSSRVVLFSHRFVAVAPLDSPVKIPAAFRSTIRSGGSPLGFCLWLRGAVEPSLAAGSSALRTLYSNLCPEACPKQVVPWPVCPLVARVLVAGLLRADVTAIAGRHVSLGDPPWVPAVAPGRRCCTL